MKHPWWIAIALWCACSVAAAQSDAGEDTKKRASEHFRQGVELFHEGAYRAALVELKRAYETLPDYRVKYNIAQTQLMLGDYLDAHRGFTQYLEEGGAQVGPARRQEVEKQLDQLKARVGKLSIIVNQPGATVTVDGEDVGVSPLASTVPVNVGAHRVFAKAPDGATASENVEVAGGELAEVNLELTPIEVAVGGAPAVDQGRSSIDKAALATLAGAVALAIGAGVAGGLAASSDSELDDVLGTAAATPEATAGLRDELDRRALTSDVLSLAAIAAGATAMVLWLIPDDDGDEQAPSARLEVGPLGARITGQF